MRNNRVFEVTLSARECADLPLDLFGDSAYGPDAIERFAEVLRQYGLDVDVEYPNSGRRRAKLTVAHPEAPDARRLRNRGGGRPRKAVEWPPEMGLTDAERLEWLDSHTEAEGMSALGCSRSTYYRRLRALRAEVS